MLTKIGLLLKSNLWTKLIDSFASWIGSYGWAIIVFTIVLKLVISPIDIAQRVASQKQSRVMNAMQPELNVINEKYKGNQEKINQETQKLYKKYNTGLGGMCFIMALSLILSVTIVFSLYGAVRKYGNDKLYSTYHELNSAYETAVTDSASLSTQQEKDEYIINVVKDKYDEINDKNSWLWVKNVWKSDTKESQFVNIKDYIKHYKLDDAEAEIVKTNRTEITNILGSQTKHNGTYVLIIICALIPFLTQYVSMKLLQPKGQKMTMANKVMLAIVPITMLILATTSNVIYTLYVIINSVMTTLISLIISLFMKKGNNQDNSEILLKKKNVEVVEYSRNYKK